ncbi:MAG: orotidine-5'-phosphate decarboxylase [Nitrospirae bacterium]|nr:orotidine-5'-phosphate decarboxylase [Nitrospirota bacterium]
MEPKDRIILALDVSSYEEAVDIIEKFREDVNIFKVGLELFTSAGTKIVEKINSAGKKVFLDLKFHDIPNTVSKSALAAAELGVFMLTIHTSGGFAMMQKTAEALVKASLKENFSRPKILGVTVLTSIDNECLKNEVGIAHSMTTHIKHLSALALKAGLDGVVASPQEAEIIRSNCGKNFLIVTPGIRPSWAPQNDQKRTLTPKEALQKGADYLVIGRAVMSQPDPVKALKLIHDEIADA